MRISDWSSDVCSSDLLPNHSWLPSPCHRLQSFGAPGLRRLPIWVRQDSRSSTAHDSWCLDQARILLALYHTQIGRASCRERVCQYGVDLGGRRIIKKKNYTNWNYTDKINIKKT